MLHAISWGRFSTVILSLTAIYYLSVSLIFYRKAIIRWLKNKAGLVVLCGFVSNTLIAQDGKAGIAKANEMIRGYYDTGVQLMYAIAAILALIGAVRVFQAFNAGHNDEAKHRASAWFGACIFLVIVATVIKSFFGV